MMVPGSNLLNMALGVIQPTRGATVEGYLGEVENDFGGTEVSYKPAAPLVNVSIQPMSKQQTQQTGLALNKSYIQIWVNHQIQGAYRGRQNDIINWAGYRWEVQPDADWMIQDGWVRIIAVKL